MKLFLILMLSLSAGYAAADHIQSFVLGLSIASAAVAGCYWVAFRSDRFPEFMLALLFCGLLVKVVIAALGLLIASSAQLIGSPFVFAMSYLYFSIIASLLFYTRRNAKRRAQPSA